MLRFVLFATALSVSSFADLQKENTCPDGKRQHRATLRHIESGGIGYKDGYTTLELFLATNPSDWIATPFLDIRGHIFDNGQWAGNVGIGTRGLWRNRAYGINAYYDFRNVNHLNAKQVGLGLETLGKLVDFRINGYLPVSKKTSDPYDSTFGAFSGNYLLLSQKYKSAMKGANAEVGFHFGQSKSFDFYAAAGPYYFIGEKAPATWGGKAKLSGSYKDIVTLEISDSYDRTFHNKFQGQIGLRFSFGPKSKVVEKGRTCSLASTLNDRMLQPVDRQEIIVIDNVKKKDPAIDPATGLPYFFVFVDNTSSSNGTYESPYHSFAQAEANSSPHDIIYVFPGDGTTTGMDAGIALQASQKLWGSGVSHLIQTSQGTFSIPAQTASSPIITNTDLDTDGDAITLATNNAISGFTISAAGRNGIFGNLNQNLDVSFCTFQNVTTYPIEATFSDEVVVSLTNNQFLTNANGISLTFAGPSTLTCANNTFDSQTSVSSAPIEIIAGSSTLDAQIENNLFTDNVTGCIRASLTEMVDVNLSVLNNTMTANGTGSQSSLGSNLVVLSTGTNAACSLTLQGNELSEGAGNGLYFHTSGVFTTLEVTALDNTISEMSGAAMVLGTPVNALTFVATDNTITSLDDNGISVISSGLTTTGNIAITNNTITDIGSASNGIAVNQDFTTLDLTIANNQINGCEGTGIVSYPPTGIGFLTLDISDNTISGCQNQPSNASSAIGFDNYLNLVGTLANNTLSDNTGLNVAVGIFTPGNPDVCLNLTGNSCDTSLMDPSYSLSNPGTGAFNLSPCNVDSVNVGTIQTTGTITPVQSCPGAEPCP